MTISSSSSSLKLINGKGEEEKILHTFEKWETKEDTEHADS